MSFFPRTNLIGDATGPAGSNIVWKITGASGVPVGVAQSVQFKTNSNTSYTNSIQPADTQTTTSVPATLATIPLPTGCTAIEAEIVACNTGKTGAAYITMNGAYLVYSGTATGILPMQTITNTSSVWSATGVVTGTNVLIQGCGTGTVNWAIDVTYKYRP